MLSEEWVVSTGKVRCMSEDSASASSADTRRPVPVDVDLPEREEILGGAKEGGWGSNGSGGCQRLVRLLRPVAAHQVCEQCLPKLQQSNFIAHSHQCSV